jgi:hypothetical protein
MAGTSFHVRTSSFHTTGTVFACVDWFCELCRNKFASKNASCLQDYSNTKQTLFSRHQCDELCSTAMLRELWRKSCNCWRYLQLADPAKIGKETTNLQSLTKRWRVYAPIVVKLLKTALVLFIVNLNNRCHCHCSRGVAVTRRQPPPHFCHPLCHHFFAF